MYTITLNGNSSELSSDIFPSIEVEHTAQICLLSLLTNNSIPTLILAITYPSMDGKISIPTGTYELEDLESVINKLKPEYITFFELKSDINTLKCKISCSHEIDFSIENSIATLLGFKNVVYTTGSINESENTSVT
ncbi:Uncharacterized protein FWK35_00034736 [Aphis craccivora]|uniref:Uncharacterized protein n=1 Tax=Aphis craccivora TaxID=307492 RepID=A0A6G0VK41_APHCR|nr:Uncharacterized protein FWK35_00034736 [Aphis craccivora]